MVTIIASPAEMSQLMFPVKDLKGTRPHNCLTSQSVTVNVPCERLGGYMTTIIISPAKVSQLMFPVKDLEGT